MYAESSAVLAWLLAQNHGTAAKNALARAEIVVTSDLTITECHRVLVRAVHLGLLSETDSIEHRGLLEAAYAHWQILAMAEEVLERTHRAFPLEPVRTLDAIHLASALVARSAWPGIGLLSLDERVRRNGATLGFTIVPRQASLNRSTL